MMMSADAILSMLRETVAGTYGDPAAMVLGADASSGAVVVCAPLTNPAEPVWALSVRPGPAPLEIEVLGDLPLDDPRFQQAIGEPLVPWVREPEQLNNRELAVLSELGEEAIPVARLAF